MTEEKREKVIKGLECCLTDNPSICEGCPYLETGCLEDVRHFKHDILLDCLALLKAQEPVKPLKMAVDYVRKEPVVFSYKCPVCMCGLQQHWVACPICGTGVKLE